MHISKILLLILIVVLFSSYDYLKGYTWYYRITIEVETPEGIKTGSTVRRVVARLNTLKLFPQENDFVHHITGEAVVVDLGERGVLFALIDLESYLDIYNAIPSDLPYKSIKHFRYYDALPSGTHGILEKEKPTLVTFDNLEDPKTFKKLEYGELESTLGKGVKINQILIELTDDPYTIRTVDKYLSREFWDTYCDWTRSMNTEERDKYFTSLDFTNESKKPYIRTFDPPR